MKQPQKDNLELDSRMAMDLGYGVHYGRFKADHPHTMDAPVKIEGNASAKCAGRSGTYTSGARPWCINKLGE